MLDELYVEFCKIDTDGSGLLDKSEVGKYVDGACQRCPDVFDHEKLLKDMMDLDGD